LNSSFAGGNYTNMRLVLSWIISYLIGSIPTGLIVAKLVGGRDIRDYGSGNIGATNVARVIGKKWGALVLALDILKGFIPVVLLPPLLGVARSDNGFVDVSVGAAAVLGHCFSAFLNFRGGKGVATAIGVFLAIAPLQIAILAVIGLVLIAWKGYVSLASVTCAALLPFVLYLADKPWVVQFVSEILAAVVIIKHWPNMERLLRGEERAIWDSQEDKGDAERIPTTQDEGADL
jgi:glycerol-3-phosphate acyltransferase PlsY